MIIDTDEVNKLAVSAAFESAEEHHLGAWVDGSFEPCPPFTDLYLNGYLSSFINGYRISMFSFPTHHCPGKG